MTTAKNIVEFPKPHDSRRVYEAAFLPAALEIVETPASPAVRAINAMIIMLFCAALVWASLGTVDIVAIAPGKVVQSGRTKLIQPFETGVVRAIRIRDGATVKAGDVLVELDPTINEADAERMKGDAIAAELDVARLRAAIAEGSNPLDDFVPPKGASARLIEMHRQFLAAQMLEHNTKLAEIDRQSAQKEMERQTIAAAIGKLEATNPVLEERVNVRKYLYDNKIGSKIIYLSELQDLVGQQHELLVQQSRQREVDAAIAALAETRSKTNAEYRRLLFDDLTKAEQKAAGLRQEVVKAEQKAKLQALTAPIDGTVQQLAVHTVGGVVTPAQVLAVIVASDSDLEIEAAVSNRDIGFVFSGQDAEIKVDTFNFTRYGLIRGHVVGLSPDAIASERSRDQPSPTTDGSASESTKQDPTYYTARIALERTQMQIDGKSIRISPGMAVTVEIKTGSRRIISYLLSPFARYKHDILRER